MNDEYLTVQEIAEYMRISESTVLRAIHGKLLEAQRHGRVFRVSKTAADKYLKAVSTIQREEII